MIETSRGSVVAWECDENAHLNVQFYTARITEATEAVGQSLGLSLNRTKSGLMTLASHSRFMRELRVGDPIRVRSGITELHNETLTCHHEVLRGDELAASICKI
jgi:acyl-CoA thioester hydrolase